MNQLDRFIAVFFCWIAIPMFHYECKKTNPKRTIVESWGYYWDVVKEL